MKDRNELIDIVILWVDDSDPVWRAKKDKYGETYGISHQSERFRDWDNLRYLFRGIERFAPWINHIFLVTDNQKPTWLLGHDKLTIVDHKDFMKKDFLPTFNSRALELNLHKIPNLAEQFIYFNDDMYIINNVVPEDFFVMGKPRHLAALNAIMPIKNNQMSQVIFNNTTLINDNFNKYQTLSKGFFKWFNLKHGKEIIRTFMLFIFPFFSGFKQTHLVGNYKKKTYKTIWNKYENEMMKTSKSKFRDFSNFNQWLISDWQLASNNFVPQKRKFGKVFQLSTNESVIKCKMHIMNKKTKVICVNDTEMLKDFEFAKKHINEAFESVLPSKSSFEE